MKVGKVLLVGAGPGDPELITVRGRRALQEADVVLYDNLVGDALLSGLDADLVYVGKRCGKHQVPQEATNDMMVSLARRGMVVVRLKGGDPTVFGRGGEEARHLAAHAVPYEIVPGVSSCIAAPASAHIPVTYRGVADGVSIVTAHRRRDQHDFAIPDYHARRTLILLMGVRTMAVWREQLLRQGYPPELPVALVTEATQDEQRVVTTDVAHCVEDARDAQVEPPTTAIIGRVVALRDELLGLAYAAAPVANLVHEAS
ncbi:MAG: uroporphyrinogen-III C-methyltransferase [Persicimonas sp.]